MKTVHALLSILPVFVISAAAQTTPVWDTSGNKLLNGTYNFRHVVYLTTSSQGLVGRKMMLQAG